MMEWNNASDKMPKDRESVLVTDGDEIVSAWYDPEAMDWVCFDDKFSIDGDGVTHWAEKPCIPM
jgi:hypothetical protein